MSKTSELIQKELEEAIVACIESGRSSWGSLSTEDAAKALAQVILRAIANKDEKA